MMVLVIIPINNDDGTGNNTYKLRIDITGISNIHFGSGSRVQAMMHDGNFLIMCDCDLNKKIFT